MNDIRSLLRSAARRLYFIDVLQTLTIALSAGLGALIVILLAHKFTAWEPAWERTLLATGVAAVVLALVWSLVRRPRGMALADEIDRRADLRETVSTAFLVSGSEDSWNKAVVESAVVRARSVDVRAAAPIEAPRGWWVPIALAAVLFGGMMTPWRYDLTGVLAQREIEAEEQREFELVSAEVKAAEEKVERALAQAGIKPEEGDEEEDGASEELKPEEPKTPEEVRRAALKKLTSLNEELTRVRDGEKGKTLEAMRSELSRLKTPGEGPAQEFGRNLARGNFTAAREALEKMMQEANSGELSDEQKQELKRQLEDMANQMDQLAKDQSALERELQEAGFSAEQAQQMAQNQQAMQEGLEQAQNLTEAQKQAMQAAQQAAESASNALQGMSGAMGQMAQGMQQGQQGVGQQGVEGMAGMAGQLSGMEMMQAEMGAVSQAMSTLQSQMAQISGQGQGQGQGSGFGESMGGQPGMGQFAEGNSNQQGQRTGGAGRGENPFGPDESPSDFLLKTEKATVRDQGGPTIGETTIYGQQIIGESTIEVGEAVAAATARAEDAIETMRVPRELHDPVRNYFGRIEEQVKENREKQEAAGEKEPAGG